MDGFSYSDIFATKGVEYLVIITFLGLLIPFWFALNKQERITVKVQKALSNLSAGILRIPHGLFYGQNHTWMYMEKSGTAKIGLDDLLLHITGEVEIRNVKHTGDIISKGDLLTEIDQNGKLLRIVSPVSGKITDINSTLNQSSAIRNEDPYGKGWIYKIKPSDWIGETTKCHFAEEATAWSAKELERFKDFLAVSMKNYSPETSMIILQDGGELRDHSLSELPVEIWKDFEKEFLNLN
jgi:glycine cleavage system H protein